MSVLTIGAQDLGALRAFYETVLGWKPVASNTDIVFYRMNGFLLSLCDRKMLVDFIGLDEPGEGRSAMTIGHNVETKEAVLALYEALKDRVTILKKPTEPPFGGLVFYFADVEGNIIEVAQNPYVTLDKAGNAFGHEPIDGM